MNAGSTSEANGWGEPSSTGQIAADAVNRYIQANPPSIPDDPVGEHHNRLKTYGDLVIAYWNLVAENVDGRLPSQDAVAEHLDNISVDTVERILKDQRRLHPGQRAWPPPRPS